MSQKLSFKKEREPYAKNNTEGFKLNLKPLEREPEGSTCIPKNY